MALETHSGGFWRRLAAVVIDAFLIVLAHFLTARWTWSLIRIWGPGEIWVWLTGIFCLWTVFYGPWGGGRTPGAWLTGLRVGNSRGECSSWWNAAARSLIFTFWVYVFRIPEALAIFWADAGHPWFGAFVAAIWLGITVGSCLLMPFDRPRRSPLDLLSGTRVFRVQLTEPAPASSEMPTSRTALLYVLLTIIMLAGIQRYTQKGLEDVPKNPRLMHQLVRWFASRGGLLAPRVSGILVNQDGLPAGKKVPTLRVQGWMPMALMESAKFRDYEARMIAYEFKKEPELMAGFHQLELLISGGTGLGPLPLRNWLPYYFELRPDVVSSRYYQDRPQVSISTGTVTQRYQIIRKVPEDWEDRLYVKRDLTGIAREIQAHLAKANELDGEIIATQVYRLAAIPDRSQFFKRKKVLDGWIKQSPRAALPYLLRGELQQNYAWTLRGGGFSMYVDKKQWEPFFEQMSNARADLEAAARLDPRNPLPWAHLIEVVRALQEPHEVERKCHREALARGPWYLQARTSYMHGLTPQWGGSIPQMKKYVAECEEAARHYPLAGLLALEPIGYEAGAAKEAYQVYASTSNWPVIAHVYDRILSRYPDAGLYRSQYAWYAYKARKYEVAAEQFERLGDRYFPGGYWDNLSYYSVSRAYAYNARGWIDLQADRLQTGMPWLLKGLEYNPRDPWPMAKLATCYHRLGNAEKTAEWARKALANSPSNLDKQEAENELAWAESQKKR